MATGLADCSPLEVSHCSHEKMCLSNYWRITIIYVWKRNLPLAFVAQHKMNPVQLSHFVSLHDCSLALSTPLAPAPRLAPLSSHHCISPLGNNSVSQSLGSEGSMPNDVIRLLELPELVAESQLRSLSHRLKSIQVSCGSFHMMYISYTQLTSFFKLVSL